MIALGAAAATAGATSIAACGGEEKSSAIDAAQADAPSDAAMQSHADARYYPDAVAANPSYGASACPIPVRESDIIPWKAPVAGPGACSAGDMSALRSEVMNANATFVDIYKALSPTCAACVFSEQASANWQPIVWVPDMAAGTALVNYGACYAVAPGGSAACGKGIEDDHQCIDTACPRPDCDGADMGAACTTTVAMGDCRNYEDEVTAGCASNVVNLNALCGDFLSNVNVVCGSGMGDGGSSDSGSD